MAGVAGGPALLDAARHLHQVAPLVADGVRRVAVQRICERREGMRGLCKHSGELYAHEAQTNWPLWKSETLRAPECMWPMPKRNSLSLSTVQVWLATCSGCSLFASTLSAQEDAPRTQNERATGEEEEASVTHTRTGTSE